MSNIVKIKHGSTVPTSDNLESYELGYCTGDEGLYIKEGDEVKKINETDKTISVETTITTSTIADKELGFSTNDNRLYLNNNNELVPVGGGGVVVSDTAPDNTDVLWIDTTTTPGISKYYDGTEWKSTASTWG